MLPIYLYRETSNVRVTWPPKPRWLLSTVKIEIRLQSWHDVHITRSSKMGSALCKARVIVRNFGLVGCFPLINCSFQPFKGGENTEFPNNSWCPLNCRSSLSLKRQYSNWGRPKCWTRRVKKKKLLIGWQNNLQTRVINWDIFSRRELALCVI